MGIHPRLNRSNTVVRIKVYQVRPQQQGREKAAPSALLTASVSRAIVFTALSGNFPDIISLSDILPETGHQLIV